MSPIHLPENYAEVLYWKLSHHKTLLVVLNVVGLALMGLALPLFFAWARLWQPIVTTLEIRILQMGATLIAVVSTIVLHELVHGLALRGYGAQPKYGVLWKEGMFYATAAGQVSVTASGATTFTVTANSQSGNAFAINRVAAGGYTRTCTTAGDGGCKAGGTW